MLLSLSYKNKIWLFSFINILSILFVIIYYGKIKYYIEEYTTIAEAETAYTNATDETNQIILKIEELNTANSIDINNLSNESSNNSVFINGQEGFVGGLIDDILKNGDRVHGNVGNVGNVDKLSSLSSRESTDLLKQFENDNAMNVANLNPIHNLINKTKIEIDSTVF